MQEYLLQFKEQHPEVVFMFEEGWLYLVYDEPLWVEKSVGVSFLEQKFYSKKFDKSFVSLLNSFNTLVRHLS